MLEDLDDDERAVWLAAFGVQASVREIEWTDADGAAWRAVDRFRKARASQRMCMVALINTAGNYYCTRREGHEGPCAAVPVL